GVADVQVAIGLGREAGLDGRVLAAGQVLANDLPDEVVLDRRLCGGLGGSVRGRGVGHAGSGEAWETVQFSRWQAMVPRAGVCWGATNAGNGLEQAGPARPGQACALTVFRVRP